MDNIIILYFEHVNPCRRYGNLSRTISLQIYGILTNLRGPTYEIVTVDL